MATHDVAGRVDEHDGRPGVGAPITPHRKVAVVDHRVLEPVTPDDVADVLGVALIGELGTVDPDHDQLVGVLRLESLQVGDDVDAVDTPVGPEVEQDQLAAQLCEAQGTLDVEPLETVGKLRSGRRAGERVGVTALRRGRARWLQDRAVSGRGVAAP